MKTNTTEQVATAEISIKSILANINLNISEESLNNPELKSFLAAAGKANEIRKERKESLLEVTEIIKLVWYLHFLNSKNKEWLNLKEEIDFLTIFLFRISSFLCKSYNKGFDESVKFLKEEWQKQGIAKPPLYWEVECKGCQESHKHTDNCIPKETPEAKKFRDAVWENFRQKGLINGREFLAIALKLAESGEK